MDFNQHEATVINFKSQIRQSSENQTAGISAINLHPAGVRAFFKLGEVQNLLPLIFKLTKKASEEVTALMDRIHLMEGRSLELEEKIEAQINQIIQEWQNKTTKLGALPKGLWLLDFDSGDGYFCWKYPEPKILFWHHYQDGFSKRICVEKYSEN